LLHQIVKEQLKVPAKIEYLGELRDFVTKVGRRHGFSERVINAFKLSIDEAATNIIKHAYRDWEGDITIRAIVKKHSLTIVLIDQGKYFDPRQVSDPDLQRYVDIGKKGGLGIFIMRRLLDDIDYRKTEEGNELLLFKNRDVARKRRITVPSIPLSLKARYWLVSAGIYTLFIISVYTFFFVRQDDRILARFLDQGRSISYILANEIANNIEQQLSPEVKQQFIKYGSQMDTKIGECAAGPINNLLLSEHRDLIFSAFVVDNSNTILASLAEDSVLRPFKYPKGARLLQKQVFLYDFTEDSPVMDIERPVLDQQKTILCRAHILLDYSKIRAEIKSTRFYYLNLVLLVWVIGLAILFLFIYLIMNPFRRLQEWVKALGQPGVAEEMDIDASTEVGEIAQAFSDITQQLRESQKNLAEQERLQQEMQVAKEIQQTLLPSEVPELEGYEIASYYEAAKEVGGDYFDFIEVDKDTLGIVVGDVSGKGVPGSLVMTMIRTALRTEARGIYDAAEVLARVNDFIVNDMKRGMFVTLFYVIIDSKRRRLNYASAGHNPMILFRASTGKTYYLNPRGFPIGISLPDKNLFKNSIESDTIALAEDDILLVYTDGITEAMNVKRHMYGEERFLNVIRKHGSSTAKEFVQELHQEILSFTEGYPQSDDITLVAIEEKATAEKIELIRAKRAYQEIKKGLTIKDACETTGISLYAYNKYREQFDKDGIEGSSVVADTEAVEVKHLSIEEKTKIFDVIRRFPEYGAKRISEELSTSRYEFTEISAAKIYEELVRSRLNTKEMREAYVARGGRKKRLKPPGTPLLTIDGQVIIRRRGLDKDIEEEPSVTPTTEKAVVSKNQKANPQAVIAKQKSEPIVQEMPLVDLDEDTSVESTSSSINVLNFKVGELLETPFEDLFDKRRNMQDDVPVELEISQKSSAEMQEMLHNDQNENKERSTNLPQISEEALLQDLAIPEDFQGFRMIEEEEKEFADMIRVGGGIEDPDLFQDQSIFQGSVVEDISIVSEDMEKIFTKADELDPLEDFLSNGDKKRGNSSESDFGTLIAEQLLQQDLSSQYSESTNRKTKSNFQLSVNSSVHISDDQIDHQLSFDNLIVQLENDVTSIADSDQDFDQLLLDVVSNITADENSTNEMHNDYMAIADESVHHQDIFRQALQLYEEGKFEAALNAIVNIITKYPNSSQAHILLGNACYRLRKFQEAAKEFETVIKIDPQNLYARENLGVVYVNQGNIQEAISQWERLLLVSPQRQDIQNNITKAKSLLKGSNSFKNRE
jgi:serine phosphatase RsbU (regulator of sigma subunit)/anti-sigma regulatory factor (Ser/Thr protein kinase)/TolA-binding protein